MEKALLIFDVDETLLHATEEILDYPPDFQLFHYHVYKRPGLDAFLGSVSNNYRISIWSSASEDYVEQCIKNVGVLPFRFEFVWSRSHPSGIEGLLDVVKLLFHRIRHTTLDDASPIS